MAAGRFVVPPYFPARDRDFNLLSGALLYVYQNETTTKVNIYTDEALTVLSSNPVVANSSGQFPAVYAEAGTEASPVLYSVSVTTSTGASPGNPFNFDNYRPSVDWETAALALAEAAAEAAETSAAEAAADLTSVESIYDDILAIVATGSDAAAIAARALRDGSNLTGSEPAEFLAVLNGVSLTALDAADGSSLVGFVQGGTGAVAGLLQNRLRETISVFDFMTAAEIADVQAGTGALYVETAINNAITAAAAKNSVVMFPAGTYTVSGAVTGKTNVTLRGEGKGKTTLKRRGGSVALGAIIDLPDANVANFRVEGMTIDGNKANNPADSSHCFRAYLGYLTRTYSNIEFDDVAMVNATNGGVYLQIGSGYRFRSCDFDDNGIAANPTSAGIFVSEDVSNIEWLSCRFRRNYEHGSYTIADNFLFDDCDFEDNGGNGLSQRGSYGIVSNCRGAENGGYDIVLNAQYQRIQSVIVSDFQGFSGNGGISIDDDVEDIQISGGELTAATFSAARGIVLNGANGGKTSTRVRIRDIAIVNYSIGVLIQPDALDTIEIDGVTTDGDGTNAYVPIQAGKNAAAASLTGDNFSVHDNSCKRAGNPIAILSTCAVTNVRARDNYVTALDGTWRTESFVNNGTGTPATIENWTKRTIAAIDFGTVNANSSKDSYVAITGSGYGAHATVTPLGTATDLPAGLTWCVMSDSANSGRVIVRMANCTTSNITVGSVNFYVEVRK